MRNWLFVSLGLMIVHTSAIAGLSIERWHTEKGAQVLYAHTPELNMIDIRVVFDAGSARDGDVKGVAFLTNELIGMGDTKRDEEAFSSAIEQLGVQLSTSAHKDMAVLNIRSLTDTDLLTPAIGLVADAIAQPSFLPAVFQRQQAQLLTALTAKKQSPGTVATEKFWQKLYGHHPYATPSEGTEASIRAMTVAQISEFYQRYYVANDATIAIVGSVDIAQAKQIAEQLMAGLPAGTKPDPLPSVVHPAPTLEQVSFASAQTQIVMGQLGLSRSDADYPVLYLANHILGGSGFASRLMEEVREKRGLVYGVNSSLLPMRATGPWMVSLKTANANASEALMVMQETVQGLLKDISQDELDRHKDNIIGGFALETDSNKDIVGYLAMMGFYDLPSDWLATFPDKIRQITRETLMSVIQQRLKPQWWTGVVLGNPSDPTVPTKVLPVTPTGGHH